MLLGGIRYLLPVIEAAHKMGVYVITADYLPDNIAHKYSDEYVNVSILDRDAVLKVAEEKQIDGIMSFGVDPGVVTAAYVAEKMGLAYPPLASCEILQNKDKFRDFLAANGFNCPFHKNYADKSAALKDADSFPYPMIVKPVDSAGSKGCMRVNSAAELPAALDEAIGESHSGRFIIEQFLELDGYQTGSDSFSIDGKLCFCAFDSQTFDASSSNPYAPSAHVWPSLMPLHVQEELRGEIQRLIKLLNLGTSIYNIEARLAKDGKAYIMEVSPRAGGNRLSEVLVRATGQDIIANNVRFALGFPVEPMSEPKYDGSWAVYVVHCSKAGIYRGISIKDDFAAEHVKACDMYIEPGTKVEPFTGANQAIGTIFLRFENNIDAKHAVENAALWMKIDVDVF